MLPVTPNAFAYFALLVWPLVTLVLYARLTPAVATAACLLGARMLLPVRLVFAPVGLPDIGRVEIATLSALLGLACFARPHLRLWRHGGFSNLLVAVMILSPFATSLANADPLQYGPHTIEGQTLYDGLPIAWRDAMLVAIPFLLGRELVRRPEDLRRVLVFLVGFMLAYSVLVLWEVRMSPNLHRMVYGYHPHSFAQHIRGSGYRPVVFATHGLDLSLVIAVSSLAAFGLARAGSRLGRLPLPPRTAGFYLMIVLALCRSMGSLVYGLTMAPVVALTRPRVQVRLAAGLATLVIVYPLLRATDLFPTHGLVEAAKEISPARAFSLDYRFKFDARILAKARQRFVLGWGSWGRWRLYDDRTGEDVTVSDGYWVIVIGSLGLVGFASFFLLVLWPVFVTARRLPRIRAPSDRALIGATALIVAVHAIDLLPNAHASAFAIFLAGSLDGTVRAWRPAVQASRAPAPPEAVAAAAESRRRVPGFG